MLPHKITVSIIHTISALAMVTASATSVDAALIVDSPLSITHRVTVQPIIASNSDGSNPAEFFGTALQENAITGFVDQIWSQAGIDIAWLTPRMWSDNFANIGVPGSNSPRPTSDLGTIVANGDAAGVGNTDPLVIDMYFVEIVPGFSSTSDNTANGLASIDANGISFHTGDNLPTFTLGQEVVASVAAHEIGHNLGLLHITEAENLMQAAGSPNQGERFNATQIATALGSPFASAVPEPSSVLLLSFGVGVFVFLSRRKSVTLSHRATHRRSES